METIDGLVFITICSVIGTGAVLAVSQQLDAVKRHNANSQGVILPLSASEVVGAWFTHGVLVVGSCWVAAVYMKGPDTDRFDVSSGYWPLVGLFFILYNLFVLVSRWWFVGVWVVYEAQWCCNHSQVLAGLGMWFNIPLLVGVAVMGICCDQCCWFVDAFFLIILRRKPPIGVMTFLTKPHRHIIQVLTTLHHFWFMPVCLYALGWQLPLNSWLCSCVFTCTATFFSRWLAPKEVWVPVALNDKYDAAKAAKHGYAPTNPDHPNSAYYLNINAAYEFWRDVRIWILHIFNSSPWFVYWLWVTSVGNFILNGGVALLLLLPILRAINGEDIWPWVQFSTLQPLTL